MKMNMSEEKVRSAGVASSDCQMTSRGLGAGCTVREAEASGGKRAPVTAASSTADFCADEWKVKKA